MVTGHAAGTLAALSAKTGTAVKDIPTAQLQEALQSQGALLERTTRIPTAAPDIAAADATADLQPTGL